MKAIIIGSSGLTGSILLQKLLLDPQIEQVISVSRHSLKIKNTKLTEVLVPDFSKLEQEKEKLAGDLYYCCLGTTIKKAGSKDNFRKIDHRAILDFANIAKAHQAKSFLVVSAMGANANSHFFYNQVKGETENDLISLGLHSLMIFRPSLLIGPRQEFRPTEKIFASLLKPMEKLLPTKIKKTAMTEVDTLAAKILAESKKIPARSQIQIFEATEI